MKFWQALFGPSSAIVNGWLKSKAKTKAVESWTKAAKAEAETEIMQVTPIIKSGWERVMARGDQNL